MMNGNSTQQINQMEEYKKLSPEDWKDLIERVQMNAEDKGFHDVKLSDEHKLMLIISEVSEAVEADREGRLAQPMPEDWQTLNDEEFKMTFLRNVKDSLEDELADVVIRMMSSGYLNCFTGTKDYFREVYECKSKGAFVERAFRLVNLICEGIDYEDLEQAASEVFFIADELGIDLMKHIQMKMRYNAMRPRLHGKAY